MASLELRPCKEHPAGIWHVRWRDKRGKLRSKSLKIVSSPKNDVLAQKAMIAFETELRLGKSPVQSIKIGALLDDVLNDYRTNGKRSLMRVQLRIDKHLRPWFGEMRADRLGADDWREYQVARQSNGAANGSINLELATLLWGYTLALASGRIEQKPRLPRLKKAPPRSGFIDRAELDSLCRHLPADLVPFVRFAFITGWRLSECLNLQWRHVSFESGEIRLEPGTTKNGEGRVFPMTDELRALLKECAGATDNSTMGVVGKVNIVLPARVPTLTPFVFLRSTGKPVRYFKHYWRKAVKAIGKPGLVFHDLRRSAIIEMDQRGIPRRVIQDLVGHRSAAMFDNYRRVGKTDLDRARELMEGHVALPERKASS